MIKWDMFLWYFQLKPKSKKGLNDSRGVYVGKRLYDSLRGQGILNVGDLMTKVCNRKPGEMSPEEFQKFVDSGIKIKGLKEKSLDTLISEIQSRCNVSFKRTGDMITGFEYIESEAIP